MKPALAVALLLCLAAPWVKAQPSAPPELPKAIQELASNIQGKGRAEVRAEIIRRFGAAQYNAGSGVRIEVWRLPEGDLSFHPFTDSDQHRDHGSRQTENFFMLHPDGTVAVSYVGSTRADTLLESKAGDSPIAQLVFTSVDGNHTARFFITSSEQDRRLTFTADKPLSFCMRTGWKSYWQ